MRAGAALVRGKYGGMYGRCTWCPLPCPPRVGRVVSRKEGVMVHTWRLAAAERERRALAAAALVRHVVKEDGNQGNLAVPAPPGRPATLTGVAFSRCVAGRLGDLRLKADLLGLLPQPGALLAHRRSPAPPRAPPCARAGAAEERHARRPGLVKTTVAACASRLTSASAAARPRNADRRPRGP
jgi:hypothetical protein